MVMFNVWDFEYLIMLNLYCDFSLNLKIIWFSGLIVVNLCVHSWS